MENENILTDAEIEATKTVTENRPSIVDLSEKAKEMTKLFSGYYYEDALYLTDEIKRHLKLQAVMR